MSEQHTPGRLYADKLQDRDACNVFAHGGTSALFTISPESTASRLVACWNACEPIADPENVVPRLLALNERVPELEYQAATLRAQRDELMEALHMALPALEAMRKQWPRSPIDDSMDVVEVVRATVTKVKGGAA